MIGTGCPLPRIEAGAPLVPRFPASGFVTFLPVVRSSISAAIVIAASVTAALVAARKLSAYNAAKRTAAINKPAKGARIIATASATTASACAPA